jgi:hypothetical protein
MPGTRRDIESSFDPGAEGFAFHPESAFISSFSYGMR